MDTELARTFLSVVAAGNFVKAAEKLCVTQSTVSARIQSLEQQLGCRLFERNKAGTTLTPAGRLFQKHAAALLRTVERARQDAGIAQGFRASLTLGGRIGVWEGLLLPCLGGLRAAAADVAIRAEIGFEDDLMQGLVEGRVDIAILYSPQSRPGLVVEKLTDEELILVSTRANASGPGERDYVYVDWGPEFYARHQASFPEFIASGLTVNVGWLGLQHVRAAGGSGYFPRRLVAADLAAGRLHVSRDAPQLRLPVYVVYPEERERDVFDTVLTRIRKAAQAEP
ncbi:MAG TPA: LysR family transcriptional regulator [Gammaproteobacteria bacterium]